MNPYLTVGLSAFAAAAVFEAALIPGIVIGGAAVLAPKYLPELRRRLQPAFDAIIGARIEPPIPLPDRQDVEPTLSVPAEVAIKQALAKAVTFRIIATSLDFTTNYVVLGELATAAGLSTAALVVGPLLYFAHETAWNYYLGSAETSVDLPALRPDAEPGPRGFTISRALAKTITFRTFATAMDFTTNFVVIGDLVTAAGLTGFAFVVGPFVYLGHEMAWDYATTPGERTGELALPANLVTVISAPAGGLRS